MAKRAKVEFENDRVRVTRVKAGGDGERWKATREDRLIIYLEDARITRTEGARRQRVRRRAGDVVWRDASDHEIQTAPDGAHEVLIVELKPPPGRARRRAPSP